MSERIAQTQCVRVPALSAIVTVSDYVKLPVPIGAFHGFDWHDYCGPVFVGKRGNPLAQQPGERHPVWDIFEQWMRHGKRVDGRGFAVLTPAAPEVNRGK